MEWSLKFSKNNPSQDKVEERHRHRYEVNPELIEEFESAGMKFVGRDVDNQRMEIMELEASIHPYYAAVQYHPEYLSRPLRPSPPFLGLILASIHKLSTFIALVSSSTKSKEEMRAPTTFNGPK